MKFLHRMFVAGGLCLLLSFSGLTAQNKVYVGLGINGSYAGLDSLNYIIDQFNQENSTYEKLMPNVHVPLGLDAHLGANLNGVLLDISYTMRLAGGRARSPLLNNQNGTEQLTLLRYNASTIDIGLGYFLVNQEMTQWALGASLDFGQLRVSARRGTRDQIAIQPWSRTVNEVNLGVSVFVQGMVAFSQAPEIGLYFRPYYQFGLVQNDYGPANRFLRPQNAPSGPFFIYQRPSNAGLKVGLYFGG